MTDHSHIWRAWCTSTDMSSLPAQFCPSDLRSPVDYSCSSSWGCRWHCLHAAETCRISPGSLFRHSWRLSVVNSQQTQYLRRRALNRDGAQERVSHVSFPGPSALLHNQSRLGFGVAEQKEGPDQGGGFGHRWGTRHRASPGQRVCQAGGQKGNLIEPRATCCTHNLLLPMKYRS